MPTLVVIGGGAGGLELATRLGNRLGRTQRAQIVLVDHSPIHIWKPHLHEVAAGSLDIGIARLEYAAQARHHNFIFQLGPFVGLDRARRRIRIGAVADLDGQPMLPEREIEYDELVIALGSTINTFGIEGADRYAVALDSAREADRFRQKLIAACMRASEANRTDGLGAKVNIAIIGAGATGVELAAELRHSALALRSYGITGIDPERDVTITVVEGANRILPGLKERISRSVHALIEGMHIQVLTSERVTAVRPDAVETASGKRIAATLVVWAAGIKAPDLLRDLDGLETNRINQLVVTQTLETTRDPHIYALGDCAACPWPGNDHTVPPRAQAAHQEATYLYHQLVHKLDGRAVTGPYRYRDFGSLVSLGASRAVGNLMGGIVGQSFFIEGMVARFMYRSLYQLHMLALHGWIKTGLDLVANTLRRATEPQIKLH